MFRGMKAFKKDFSDFTNNVPRGGIAAIRRVAKGWFAEVITLTPVDTGFTRSMWKYSISNKPNAIIVRNPRSKGPFKSPNVPGFSGLRPGDTLYIYNSVAWISRLEDGYSNQAPRNFFKNSAYRANYKLQREFNKLK